MGTRCVSIHTDSSLYKKYLLPTLASEEQSEMAEDFWEAFDLEMQIAHLLPSPSLPLLFPD